MDKYVWITILIGAPALLMLIASTLIVLIGPKKRQITDKDIVYNDRFLEIYQDHMILSGFYFGPVGRKKLPFKNISEIKIVDIGFWKGKYRVQGTGDFKTWFTHDIDRPSKTIAFILYRNNKWWRIGFSVEDYETVSAIFESKGLLTTPKPTQRTPL